MCNVFRNVLIAFGVACMATVACASDPPHGTVSEVVGKSVVIHVPAEFSPKVGDRLEAIVDVADVGIAIVGTLVVTDVEDERVVAKVDNATGKILAGQKVRPMAESKATVPVTAQKPLLPPAPPRPLGTLSAAVDLRDTRFPAWPTIKPNQPWIGESRWTPDLRQVILCGVLKDGPAGKAGLQADDTILSVGGMRVRDTGDLQKAIEVHQPGDAVPFEIDRNGQKSRVLVTLEAIPQDGGNGRILAAAEAGESWAMMDIGVRYANMRGNVSYFQKDDAEAVRWFRRAIDAGYAAGPYFLAQMYHNGKGVEKDDTQAARLYEQARSAKGEGVHKGLFGLSTANLALLYLNGQGVPKDPAKAAQLLREAADGGSLTAMLKLGELYETGNGVPKDLRQAMTFYHSAAKEELPAAEYAVGMMAYEGRGVRLDYGTARSWFELAASRGNANAMYMLGLIYESGQGVTRDDSQATEWFRKAADKGQAKARAKIGAASPGPVATAGAATLDVLWIAVPEGRLLWAVLPDGAAAQAGLRNGDIVTKVDAVSAPALARHAGRLVLLKDHQPGDSVAVEYLRDGQLATANVILGAYPDDHGLSRLEAVAEKGEPWAIHAVGVVHYINAQAEKTRGGADQEYAAAATWFFKGSNANFTYSNKLLADMYELGQGVKQDPEEARRYYEMVHRTWANRLDQLAAHESAVHLGMMALMSSPPDDARAVALFREAAEAGVAKGQDYLAFLYATGRGVPQDRDEAIRWFRKAASQGYPHAVESLKKLGVLP